MKRRLPIAAVLVVAAAAIAVGRGRPAHAQDEAGDGIARVLLFSASYCSACRDVKERVLPPLRERFGARLEIRELDIEDEDAYGKLVALEEAAGRPGSARVVPTAVIGDAILGGTGAIERDLSTLVERAISRGGTAWPVFERIEDDTSATARREDHEARHARHPIHLAFFHQTGCVECSRVRIDLEQLARRHPELVVETFNVYDDTPLALWLAERAGHEDFVTPAVFVGDEALVGPDAITPSALEALVSRHADDGAPPAWVLFEPERAKAELVERFRSFGPVAVVVAGLLDGINPCAFATLIFFVSYLTLSGRRGRDVLLVGASFTLGVFSAYLAVGLGLYRALDALGDALSIAGTVLMYLTALACLVLAALSFRDALRARRGELEDMTLTLPDALKARIRKVIRVGARARTFVLAAFATGVVVSLLELACTGQVYLPTLIFVSAIPELRARALGYLVLYNLLFILPLVVVFVLVYFGTTSKQLLAFLTRRAAIVKVGLGVLFTALALWLFVAAPVSAQGFGDISLVRSLVGRPAPPISVVKVAGDAPLDLRALRGRVIVLDFFSTFCGACRESSVKLDELVRAEGPRHLTVIGISRDPFEHLARVLVEHPRAFTVAHDETGATFDRYFARYLPTHVVIDKRGIVREVFVGSSSTVHAQLRDKIRELAREPGLGE